MAVADRRRMGDAMSEREAYDELQCYTLGHGSADFVHQHVVDAWAAQHADAHTRPIGLTFALVGLYLRVEKGWSGRQVQRAHMRLSARTRDWPTFALPSDRGEVTAVDVMASPPGAERDHAIDTWCASVWSVFGESHRTVAVLLERHGVV